MHLGGPGATEFCHLPVRKPLQKPQGRKRQQGAQAGALLCLLRQLTLSGGRWGRWAAGDSKGPKSRRAIGDHKSHEGLLGHGAIRARAIRAQKVHKEPKDP